MIAFQVFSIFLMLFQSFFAAYYLGVSVFGAQMLALAPVFLGQAVFEPYIQSEMNSSLEGDRVGLNLGALFFIVASLVFLVVVLNALLSSQGGGWLLLTLFAYIFYTALMAAGFSKGFYGICTKSAGLLFGVYVLSFFVSDAFFGSFQLIFANLVGFSVASIYLFFKVFSRLRFNFYSGSVKGGRWYEGLLFRLPIIFFTSMSTILMGMLGFSNAVIGEFRVFVSAVSAGRNFNLVPLPKLQVAISKALSGGYESELNVFVRYVIGLILFSVALVVVFPIAYGFVLGPFTFSRFSILLGVAFIVLQPLAYSVYWAHKGVGVLNVLLPPLVSIFIALIFWALLVNFSDPFLAMGIVAIGAAAIYAAVIIFSRGR